jgi:hypothetical protein
MLGDENETFHGIILNRSEGASIEAVTPHLLTQPDANPNPQSTSHATATIQLKTNNKTKTKTKQVGGVVGFALGGPLLALLGAAWTSYSCTQTRSDAGEAARGTGKWAIDFYNFFAKVGWGVGKKEKEMNRRVWCFLGGWKGGMGGWGGGFCSSVCVCVCVCWGEGDVAFVLCGVCVVF